LKKRSTTLENYIKKIEIELDKFNGENLQQKLNELYANSEIGYIYEIYNDHQLSQEKKSKLNYNTLNTRLNNKEISKILLQEYLINPEGDFNLTDAAIAWYASKLQLSSPKGSSQNNLLLLSNRVAQHTGYIQGIEKTRSADIDNLILKNKDKLDKLFLIAKDNFIKLNNSCNFLLQKNSCYDNAYINHALANIIANINTKTENDNKKVVSY